ncbi:hypothetical protein [Chryseobacterium sp. T20]|uniref:hypothetical protein n=1 Tax=Chryseobacterium sp. T20 TaxID=3395375 RepID=UPI0039BD7BBD
MKLIKRNDNIYIFPLLFIGIMYICSIAQDPSFGDSLVFTIQGYKGFEFSSNATNHILFSNFLSLLHKIFPFVEVHFLFVGVCILSGILSLFYLGRLLNLLDISPRSSLICIMILGLSFTFWRQAIITEVYTFYLLFSILYLINLFKFVQSKEIKYFYYLSFLLGILFLIHIQTILFLPLYLYFIFRNFTILKMHIIYGGIITGLLFSVLLIPVFMGRNTFISIFTDNSYEDSIFNYDPSIILKSIIRNLVFLIYNFLFFIVFLFWGLKNKTHLDYIAIGIIPFLVFCIKHNVSDGYVFQLIPYVFLLILMGRGLDYFPKIYIILPLFFPVIYFTSYKIVEKTSLGKTFDKEKYYKGGTRYMLFPPLNGNPDWDYFINKYKGGALYNDPNLKYLDSSIREWDEIRKKN